MDKKSVGIVVEKLSRYNIKIDLSFISGYFELHNIRDEEKMLLSIHIPNADKFKILPVSLQILVENAIKHNKATREYPLMISIFTEANQIVVKNNLQRMATQIKSTEN